MDNESVRALVDNLYKVAPKQFIKKCKSNEIIVIWVNENTLVQSLHFPTKLYSAVHQVTDVCEFGNKKKYDRWSTGLRGCGPSNVCECTRLQISSSMQNIQVSDKQQAEINQKRSATMISKYGAEFNNARSEVKQVLQLPKVSAEVHSKLSDSKWLNLQYNVQNRSAVSIASELGVYYGTVIEYCKKFNFPIKKRANWSIIEEQVCAYLSSIGIEFEVSNWSILRRKELDIYIPSKKIAIEINGLYWHSAPQGAGNPYRHLEKTIEAGQANVQLLHFTDYDWISKPQVVKSIISNLIGKNAVVYARKCKIVEPPAKFFEENSLSKVELYNLIGLEYNGVVAAASYRVIDRVGEVVIRFANFVTVVGGLCKILAAIRKNHNLNKIRVICESDYEMVHLPLLYSTSPINFSTNGSKIISGASRVFWNTGILIFEKQYDI